MGVRLARGDWNADDSRAPPSDVKALVPELNALLRNDTSCHTTTTTTTCGEVTTCRGLVRVPY